MSEQYHYGITIKKYREQKGWSQQDLAEHWPKTGGDTGVDYHYVQLVEYGKRKLAGVSVLRRLCDLLEIPPWEFGLSEHNPFNIMSNAQPPLLSRSSIITQGTSERLDQVESIINLAWEAWFASRPKQVMREITKLLPNLERMIYVPLAIIHVLHIKELVIRCHGLLGAIHLDALQNDAALYHYIQAYKFAEEIHNTNLTVTYLALMGEVLRRQNDKAAAITYMEKARDQAANVNPATLGHVLQLLAYAYSNIGNETAFEQTISEATDLLVFTGEGKDGAKAEFIPFEIYEIRGKANRDLGKPLKAILYLELAEKSLNKAESVTPRWHALLEISRGQAFCDAGDITTGIDLISKGFIMAYQCHSPYQMNRVRKLLRKWENSPFQNHPRVQNLKDLLYATYMRLENSAL